MLRWWLALVVALAAPTAAQAQDVEAGEAVFKKCRACHEVGPNAKNKVGPVLNGIVGRKAGTYDAFNYSDAMKNSGITWDEANLNEYIADPKKKIPGNKMVFIGLKDEADRANVIAFLKTQK